MVKRTLYPTADGNVSKVDLVCSISLYGIHPLLLPTYCQVRQRFTLATPFPPYQLFKHLRKIIAPEPEQN